ncbi:glycosyltransferase [Anaeromicropila herbilytica]|uniref:Rhamnosyltransferase n=1 Tax=Anaeromicropila herbilytica TaxID=2785025 RepID=A0A7R7IEF1_9FIRM|nr:glycosyltransferase [Anaeromicropila herbilytica]BCN32044.1 rhamnosyltransferase [Anaeromicropila herbilytica]
MSETNYPNRTIDVIIPTYKPSNKFDRLLQMLEKQSVKPGHIFVINTEEQYLASSRYEGMENVHVTHIKKEEFDHGGTRNYGASLSSADIIMFMTDDAVPKDEYLIENMLKAFDKEEVAACYGRQLANKGAGIIEKYTRIFNYPDTDLLKSKNDIKRLGIKTYFCSNVCAAYRNDIYKNLGGFVTKTIFNEDMIMASKIIQDGYSIQYASQARVIHSHKYTYREQFTRNFDLAVSQRQYREIFEGIKSETEGMKLVKKTIKYLFHIKKPYLIPSFIMETGFKYLGYKFGYHYEQLPKKLVVKFSMNKTYWKEK